MNRLDIISIIEIIIDAILAKILHVLLLDNFRFYDATVTSNSKQLRVKIGNNELRLLNI